MNQTHRHKTRKGFTIIELMLAMGFLGTLLVTIAILVNMITGIYQKGLSLRAVNANGKQIIDDLSRIVSGSPISQETLNVVDKNNDSIIQEDEVATALRKYYISNTTRVDGKELQLNGVFCTGAFSYIWNTQLAYEPWENSKDNSRTFQLTGDTTNPLWPKDASGAAINPYIPKLARVPDTNRTVCTEASSKGPSATFEIAGAPVELINSDEANLVLYDFTVFPATQNTITGQTFYSATFILATMRGGVDITSNGDYCNVSSSNASVQSLTGLSHDFNYCAVNKFNFAMRATGLTEGESPFGEG